MFLRLRYYFKTDRKIRVQDKQEYADQRKKLKNVTCEHERSCVRGPDNSKFVKARQEYFSQKQLVRDFWRNRMRERVKG